jgi:hypothetical protein
VVIVRVLASAKELARLMSGLDVRASLARRRSVEIRLASESEYQSLASRAGGIPRVLV